MFTKLSLETGINMDYEQPKVSYLPVESTSFDRFVNLVKQLRGLNHSRSVN